MRDAGHDFTDDELAKLKRRYDEAYSQAADEMAEKVTKRLKEYEASNKRWKEMLDAGEVTKGQYKAWLRQQALAQRATRRLADQLAYEALQTDRLATDYANDAIPAVLAENVNYGTYQVEKAARLDTSFALVDRDTVGALLSEDGPLLPIELNEPKDLRWNKQHFRSAITQGILQGESIDDIARRVQSVTGMGENSAIRAARTAMTGAENRGRVTAYRRAEDMGIKLMSEWRATFDTRTRDSHRWINGERQRTGDKFSNGCAFPGDPQGRVEEVVNCRCTLLPYVEGITYVEGAEWYESTEIEGMSYEEWRKGKATARPEEQASSGVVDGDDILGTWQRRPDQFEFEIEDVLDAQGFDGKPRIMDADEFDRAVKQANGGEGLIMQRSYSAPTQEVLDSYRDMLYDGKWYVDCSTGGAQYGQGMYCAADYSGRVTTGMREEMVHYHKLNAEKLGGVATTDEYKLGLIEDYVGRMSGTAEQRDATRTYLRTKAHVGEVTADERRAAGKVLSRDTMRVLDTQADIITQAREGSFTYVETMTLDPSAKIITYDEVVAIKEIGISELDIVKVAKSEDEVAYLRDYIGLDRHDHTHEHIVKIRNIEDAMSDDDYDRIRTLGDELISEGQGRVAQMQGMNEGSLAASLGYDAINAVGHGASGSYTVVLNRTKLIIRRP